MATPFLPALTSIRGLAAWWVVCFHLKASIASFAPPTVNTLIGNGYMGVDLFFILSGFILSHVHHSQFESLDTRQIIRFLWTRLARIYPLHLFTLVLYLSIPILLLLFSQQKVITDRYSLEAFFANVFLVHAWGLFDRLTWNGPSWSISAEWFVYLLFPLICLAIKRVRGFVPLLLGSFAPLVIMVLILDSRDTAAPLNAFSDFALVRAACEFLAGCFLYNLYRCQPLRRDMADGIGLSAVVVLVAVLVLAADSLVVPALFAIMILVLANQESRLSRLLSHKSLRFLGEISYSTYMIHYFLIDVFKLLAREEGPMSPQGLVIYLAALLVASIILYRVVELPSRNFLRKSRLRARLEPQVRARPQG